MNEQQAFQLDTAISAWRNSLQHERYLGHEDLDELEQHIRDQIHHLVLQGRSEKEAFSTAMKSMGAQQDTKAAYQQVYWGKVKQERRLKDELIWRWSMLKNYVKIAVRHLQKQKGYAFINISGLAIGLTCFILISLFVQFELSYDTFHDKSDQIYR
ncbi:MAG: permease prefix domain 1-containing protein, partial [Rhodothermales bacterium]